MRRPIATALRLWRIEQGLTQKDVAALTGIAQGDVSNHETHRHDVTESTIERYAAGYRMDPCAFLLSILTLAQASEK